MNKRLMVALALLAVQGALHAAQPNDPKKGPLYPNCKDRNNDGEITDAVLSHDGSTMSKTFSYYPCWNLGGWATWHLEDPRVSHNWDPGPEVALVRKGKDHIVVQGTGWLQPEKKILFAQVLVDLQDKAGKTWCHVEFARVNPGNQKDNTDLPPRDKNRNIVSQPLPDGCPADFKHYDRALMWLKWEYPR